MFTQNSCCVHARNRESSCCVHANDPMGEISLISNTIYETHRNWSSLIFRICILQMFINILTWWSAKYRSILSPFNGFKHGLKTPCRRRQQCVHANFRVNTLFRTRECYHFPVPTLGSLAVDGERSAMSGHCLHLTSNVFFASNSINISSRWLLI